MQRRDVIVGVGIGVGLGFALQRLFAQSARNRSVSTASRVLTPVPPLRGKVQPQTGEKRRVAILGGSFNPITHAHLSLVAQVAHARLVDEVWITPCGPRPDKPNMTTTPLHRLVMCHLAVEDYFDSTFPVKVCDYEIGLPRAKGTWSLMEHFVNTYHDIEFYFVVGDDLIDQMPSWDDPECSDPLAAGVMLMKNNILVAHRPGYASKATLPPNFTRITPPFGCV
eukprot:c5353_g1_i6.p1 GENE.c5353_g1_i6~~c5353_g1_i6.p1  ORF type:complete len:224 (-),score=32.84 c5353_g1_i6:118-789(-)